MILYFFGFSKLGTLLSIYFLKLFLSAPKAGKIGFAHGEGNFFLLFFSSVFAFKQAKEQMLFQVRPLKIVNKKIQGWEFAHLLIAHLLISSLAHFPQIK